MTSTPRMTPFLNKWIWISFFLASVSCRVAKTSFKLTQLANWSRDCYNKRYFPHDGLYGEKEKNYVWIYLRHMRMPTPCRKNSKNYIRIDQNIPLRGHRRRQTIIATTTISRITRTTTTATMVAVKDLEGDSGSFSSEIINKQADQYLVKTNNTRLKEGKNKKDRGKKSVETGWGNKLSTKKYFLLGTLKPNQVTPLA